MTNKERYKQAFSALQSSGQFHLEVEEMAQKQKKHRKNIAAAAAVACAVVIGGSGTVYAADIGGIQEKISVWLYGAKTEVEVTEADDGSYMITYERGGKPSETIGYGGYLFNTDGSMEHLSAAEFASHINETAQVEEDADGRVWVYYYDQKMEITDLFDENGICNVTLAYEDRTFHLEITRKEDGSYMFTQTDDAVPDDCIKFDRKAKEFSQTDAAEMFSTTTVYTNSGDSGE